MRGFNIIGGFSLTPEFAALLIGLTVNAAANIAEIVRSGIEAVPRNQWETGRSLAFTETQLMRLIVIPQALRVIVPLMISAYFNLTKNSSLAVAIGYPDLVSIVNTTANQTGQALEAIVGQNLRRLRRRQGLSLERLAQASGVSRAMLGQIENAKSLPTIWPLVEDCQCAVAALRAAPQPSRRPRPRCPAPPSVKLLSSSDGAFVSRALFPFEEPRKAEFNELRIGAWHEAVDAHRPGTRENLVVTQGSVEISIGGQKPVALAEGDALLFDADVPHSYRNLTSSEAVIYLVMTYTDATL